SGSIGTEPVARSAYRLERAASKRLVDLPSQVSDVDVDDVRAVLVGEVPGVFQQVQSREDLAGPPHERLEQRELLRRQADLLVSPPHLAGRRVEPKVAGLEHVRPLRVAAAGERTEAGEQLGEGE